MANTCQPASVLLTLGDFWHHAGMMLAAWEWLLADPPTRRHVFPACSCTDTYLIKSLFEGGKDGIPAERSQLPVADSFVGPAPFAV